MLFLIQLWFDTFMMHEDDFKDIIGVYKELRKDGVIFPQRNVSHQFMIKFEGKRSPIFEGIEHDRIYEEPNKTLNPNKNYEVKPDDLFSHNPFKTRRMPGTQPKQKPSNIPSMSEQLKNLQSGDKLKKSEEEVSAGDSAPLTQNDIDIMTETSAIMKEILETATELENLKSRVISRNRIRAPPQGADLHQEVQAADSKQ